MVLSFSPKARKDLLDIGDYIARDSRDVALRFVGKLVKQCERIVNSPFIYATREDLAPGLRIATMGRYVIFFQMLGDSIRIERILHSARDLPTIFGQEQV